MFGGYNIIGTSDVIKRTFKNLPSHTSVRLTGKLHILDSWEAYINEQFRIFVDGNPVYIRLFDHTLNN